MEIIINIIYNARLHLELHRYLEIKYKIKHTTKENPNTGHKYIDKSIFTTSNV